MGCIYEQEKILIKGVYYVEVSGYYGKNVLLEVLYGNDVEKGKEHYEIQLQGFNLFVEYEGGGVLR